MNIKKVKSRNDGNFVVISGGLVIEMGRIAVDDERKTSLDNVWAGGDCVVGGEDLTVCAVQDGKLAARSIDDYLQSA